LLDLLNVRVTQTGIMMGEQPSQQQAELPSLRPFLPLLLLLFIGSGCAALIYEIIWFQLLQFVIGSSAISLGVLLGTFMGGMCLGSLLLPRIVPRELHPLRAYGAMELLIGFCGLAVLAGLPLVERLYLGETVGNGLTDLLLRGGVCAVCLLVPTVLMGATLPAIARWVETTRSGVSWLGFFYGGNIAGAVFGCLLAGFYLLRVHDMQIATYVAASINALVALASIALSIFAPFVPQSTQSGEDFRPAETARWTVYLAIGVSGATALAAEVIWTRLLSLLMGATVYTFSIILAVFLVGLGIGSSIGSAVARSSNRPRMALAICQILLGTAILWTAFALATQVPFWPIMPYHSRSAWVVFQVDLARCFWAIFPATVLWGASFPLALAAVANPGQDAGRMVGGVYAANTLGAIIGALATSLWLIPKIGTQDSQRLLVALSLVAAYLSLAPAFWLARKSESRRVAVVATRSAAATLVVIFLVGGAWLAAAVLPRVTWQTLAMGRLLPTCEVDGDKLLESWESEGQSGVTTWHKLYEGEGLNASVVVSEDEYGTRRFHVSGKVEASSHKADMCLQRMLGHIPALVHPQPKTVLVVGCGAGVTAGSFVNYPTVEKIVICEIEPLVTEYIADYFGQQNYDVVHSSKVKIVHDDARHYLLTTHETFDIITSDPIHPWVKGSASLYTAEYFRMCRDHLNQGGIVTQWVPLYESSPDVVKSQVATFFEVFPEGTIWANNNQGVGYDTVIFGQLGRTRIDVDEIQNRLDDKEYEDVRQSIGDYFGTAMELFATYTADRRDLDDWIADAQINTDRNLRLQYLAGMALNKQLGNAIYNQMAKHRHFPADIFLGNGPNRSHLKSQFPDTGY
jgi:spermidine synthase